MSMQERQASARVVVIGGGYAGAVAANRLRRRRDVQVALINPRPVFVERVRLHQLVAGSGAATVDYRTLLGEGVELIVDTATRIDAAGRSILLRSGRVVDYDYAVYAVGSTAVVPASVPGALENAIAMADLESAERLRAALAQLVPDAPITVVGAGLTGVETAAELAEAGRRVTLVCGDRLAPSIGKSGRRYVARWLERHGVTVLEHTRVEQVRTSDILLSDGTRRASSLTVWAAGFATPRLAASSGLRTDDLGRLITDETLTSVDDARIVATGDAAAPSGVPLRMSCQAAGPLGAQAADTVLSLIAGTEPAPLDFAFTGSCISLGRRVALRQLAHKDDSSMSAAIGGRIVGAYKELTCRLGVWKVRREARRPGSLIWPKGGPRPEYVRSPDDAAELGARRA